MKNKVLKSMIMVFCILAAVVSVAAAEPKQQLTPNGTADFGEGSASITIS